MKLFRKLFGHFHRLFILSVAFMLILPFGTFDASRSGFYLCVTAAVFFYGLILLLLKQYPIDSKYENSLLARVFRLTQSLIFLSFAFMLFMPYGTFDPTAYGFYTCIILALFNVFLVKFLLKKYKSPPID